MKALYLSLLLLASCAKPFAMELPKELKRYDGDPTLKLISADGVRVKARELQNYPAGDLAFWADAMKVHLDARGYVFKSKSCFETKKKLGGCTLDFLVPHGPEDWILSETIFVSGDRLILIEAAAPYEKMGKIEESYKAALTTFDPN
jgi:hypothetical protein